jgi:uncharacterized protein YjdB
MSFRRVHFILALFFILGELGCGGSSKSGATNANGSTLLSIGIAPATATVAVGSQQQFKATGIYEDTSTQDLTDAVTWNSSKPAVASISSSGLAIGMEPGTSTVGASVGLISGASTLSVDVLRSLQAITVSPVDPSLGVSQQQQFAATGTYNDGSIQLITSTVTWTSSDGGVATIVAGGLATGVAAGSATITATSGSVSGTTTLNVN